MRSEKRFKKSEFSLLGATDSIDMQELIFQDLILVRYGMPLNKSFLPSVNQWPTICRLMAPMEQPRLSEAAWSAVFRQGQVTWLGSFRRWDALGYRRHCPIEDVF